MKDKNEKQVTGRGGTNKRGRVKERSKEGEYSCCTLYTRMNTEFLNLLKSPYEGDNVRKIEGRKMEGMNQFRIPS
jgi:hypothetical protein